MVRRHWIPCAVVLALVGGLAAACSGDDEDPTDPVPEALAGNWEATPDCKPPCEFSVTPTNDPGQPISLLDPPFSASIAVSVGTGGGFVLTLELNGFEFTQAGTARTRGSTIYVTLPSGAADTATYTIASDLLTLEYRNEITVPDLDLDNDGTPDPGRVRAVLRRR